MPRKLIAGQISRLKLYQFVRNRMDTWYVDKNQTSVSTVLKILFRKIRNDEIAPRANAVAFNLTLSVFPAIIFLFMLIPYIPIPQVDTRIMLFSVRYCRRGFIRK